MNWTESIFWTAMIVGGVSIYVGGMMLAAQLHRNGPLFYLLLTLMGMMILGFRYS